MRRASLLTALASTMLACGGIAILDPASAGSGGGGSGGGGNGGTGNVINPTGGSGGVVMGGSGGTVTGGSAGAPAIPPLYQIPGPTLAIGESGSFQLPPAQLGFEMIAFGNDPMNPFATIGFDALFSPTGFPVMTGFTYPGTQADSRQYGTGTVGVPNTDDAVAIPPEAGLWSYVVGTNPEFPDESGADVTTWVRQTVDGQFHGGVIDVNVFLAQGVSFAEYVSDIVTQAFEGYGGGLEIGTLNVFDAPPQFFSIDENNYFDVFELTAGAPGRPALNIVAVGEITGQLAGAAGFSPGIPGITLYHGTYQSAVVWQVFEFESVDLMILRHETGHFSGLYHTSEFEAGFNDPLEDTPACMDGDLLDQCPDYDNAMFPTGGDGQLNFTPTQHRIIQGSALYRGRVESGGGLPDPLPAWSPGQPPLPPPPAPPAPPGAGLEVWAPTPSADGTSWRELLAPELATYFEGLWCPTVAPGASVPRFYDDLPRFGLDDPEALLEVALRSDAPPHVKRRALVAFARFGADPQGALEALALDASREKPVRLGAIEGLRAASLLRASVRAALERDPIPALRHSVTAPAKRL